MLEHLRNHAGTTGIVGTISGWASFDLLRTSQIAEPDFLEKKP
jgi:hypothetical protein